MKRVVYKFYDIDGNYVGALNDSDFVNTPTFTWDVNGGQSELRMTASFSFDDWFSPADGVSAYPNGTALVPPYTAPTFTSTKGIDRIYDSMFIGFRMKIFIIDNSSDDGVQIWSGIYTGIELEYNENGEKTFTHEFVPNISRLSSRIFRNGTETLVQYTSRDPSDMFRGAVYNANVGISYTSDTVKDTGVSRTYDFNADTVLNVLQTAIKLTPNRWIWFVGGDDYLYLRNIDQHGTKHTIPLSSCKTAKFQKSIAFLRNRVLFLGGGTPPLYQQTNATGSQNAWGLYEEKMIDERVTDSSTASVRANRFLADRMGGTNYFQVEVFDNNFSENGYDIESFKPGDQVKLSTDIGNFDFGSNVWGGFTWGVDYWKYNFYAMAGIPGVIQRIIYKYDSIFLECSFAFDQQDQRIEDINRDLTNYRFNDAPIEPVEV